MLIFEMIVIFACRILYTTSEMLNSIALHNLSRRGQGMQVAVIDAGFLNVDKSKAFSTVGHT